MWSKNATTGAASGKKLGPALPSFFPAVASLLRRKVFRFSGTVSEREGRSGATELSERGIGSRDLKPRGHFLVNLKDGEI